VRLVVAVSVLVVALVAPNPGTAQGPPGERGPGDPIWVKWMEPDDPQDQTILDYWERSKNGELDASGTIDLGTMLFRRGYPKDAVQLYRQALKSEGKNYEAWFRIGLVKHHEWEVDDARHAYKKCLKLLVGHGWCNFYLGLLEEQTGHPSRALQYYRMAYKVAPEIADPAFNPEALRSKLLIGATLGDRDRERFSDALPLRYMDPEEVAEVRSRYEPTPTPEPTSEAEAAAADEQPTPVEVQERAPAPAPRVVRPPDRPTPTPLAINEENVDEAPFGIPGRRQPGGTPTAKKEKDKDKDKEKR
jgi:hypothetical protein